jgi:hypothetical protein
MGRRQRRRARVRKRQPKPAKAPVVDERTLRLAELVADTRRLAHQVDVEIDRVTRRGVGWPAIAKALGVTRQAARQRHQRRHGRRTTTTTEVAATLDP